MLFTKIHNYITKYAKIPLASYGDRSLYYKVNDLIIRLSDHYANKCNSDNYVCIVVYGEDFTLFDEGRIRYDITTYPKLRDYIKSLAYKKRKYSSQNEVANILTKHFKSKKLFNQADFTTEQNNFLKKNVSSENASELFNNLPEVMEELFFIIDDINHIIEYNSKKYFVKKSDEKWIKFTTALRNKTTRPKTGQALINVLKTVKAKVI